ncbi:unnamed protein product [Nippostrongylus brasiliensis]|uniref:Glutathione S-transferase n=1 Tax=Nippostrongylus brasiliensis TaxID=27835 RepID=A0A0N4YR04_NIPBR|nr:unnamed protein product [Nippostrongylus brasiliensis]
MVHYKLTYFVFRGLAEVIRELFALAGQEYEDVRYTFEEWPQHKNEMPFGQMPVLEVDGKQLSQSRAIARYLARQFGYAGKNAYEEAVVDSIADQGADFFNEVRPYFRAAIGFLVGDSLTWADLYLANFADLLGKAPTLYDGFPEVKAHAEKVRSIPAIKKWIETRPKSEF